MNKRPQLLTTLLVFWPLPPTRSKEASAGGETAEGGRGWEEEGRGEGCEEGKVVVLLPQRSRSMFNFWAELRNKLKSDRWSFNLPGAPSPSHVQRTQRA